MFRRSCLLTAIHDVERQLSDNVVLRVREVYEVCSECAWLRRKSLQSPCNFGNYRWAVMWSVRFWVMVVGGKSSFKG
jgi:hypothetical protein